jgi:SAM-dependent methyltransferase
MIETVFECPLCGSSSSQLFDHIRFRERVVSYRLCSGCGLVYQSPRMTAVEAESFYQQEYRQLYQGSGGPGAKDLAAQRGRAESLLAFTTKKLNQVERLLDIGCSAGLLLQRFQQAYSCRVVGVEPGQAYLDYARAQGLEVYDSLETLRMCSDGGCRESSIDSSVGVDLAIRQPNGNGGQTRFDLISMAHVLEHLPDPVSYLVALRRDWLQPGGHLLIEVPNLYAHDCFEVAHTIAFSTHTLLETVRRAGYEPLEVQQHGLPRSQLIPLYITLLVAPAIARSEPAYSEVKPWTPTPETRVRIKRQMGLLRRRLLTTLFPQRAWRPQIDADGTDNAHS